SAIFSLNCIKSLLNPTKPVRYIQRLCNGANSDHDVHNSWSPLVSRSQAFNATEEKALEGQRFDLRLLRRFRADFSIKKSSNFFPPLIASTSHLGFAPRPAQVSPEWLRYFGGTFLPFNTLPLPRTTLRLPTTANIFNCFSSSARR